MAHRFYSSQAQGFVRCGVATPKVSVGDPAANAQAILDLARRGDEAGADLIIFPELCVSAYAIDDLHLQDALLDAVEAAVGEICKASEALSPVLAIGAPVRRNGRLYNCALAISRGRILGVVPKSFLPNYREYYEKRWFAPGAGLTDLEVTLAGQTVPFGVDLIFAAEDLADFVFHLEVCEDFWAPTPPSTRGALAGALILANLSASNVVVGKAQDRAMLCASQSVRCQGAYLYSAAGPGESTTDLAWDGQGDIYELGALLAQSERFPKAGGLTLADVDVERLRLERMRTPTFNDAATAEGHPEYDFRRVGFAHQPDFADRGLMRRLDRFPFVPDDPARLDQDCYEAFNIQVEGLAQRLKASRTEKIVIGVSGGLDSTHALIVAAKACDLLSLPRANILAFTLPGFATSDSTKSNAWALMRAIGATAEEIDITPAARQMLKDLGHPAGEGEPVYDVTFENVQAGLRTDFLFRAANQRGGIVLGTGDLSELALGWCTYGVGDQMSHYGVNAGVPKTLMQHLIRWVISSGQLEEGTSEGGVNQVLTAILEQEISPELIPVKPGEKMQSTEDSIGPYALHDFTLFHVLRRGYRPSKIAFLALHAWQDGSSGEWPAGYPEADHTAYDLATIKRWEQVFFKRFFANQFKRSALPNGPKVVSGGTMSPRGDWRMPSDASAKAWLDELEHNVPRD